MCFSITLFTSSALSAAAQQSLSAIGPLHVEGGPGANGFYAFITEDQSCGCSMLDTPDMEGECWKFAGGIPEALAQTLIRFAEVVKADFELVAVFSEAEPTREVDIDLAALVELARANRVADLMKYKVTQPAA